MQNESLSKPISRRKFLKWATRGVIVAGGAFLGLEYLNRTKVFSQTGRRFLMGTFADITAYGPKEEQVLRAIDEAYTKMIHVDESMSVFKVSSPVYKINASSDKKEAILDPNLAYVLTRANEFSEVTSGSFDITVAPLMKVWGFYDGRLDVPSDTEIEETLEKVGYENINFDKSEGILRFAYPDMEIDLGSIAKGYAVDKAIEKLKGHDLSGGLVNAGGDIRVFGSPSKRDTWSIGLQNPLEDGDILCPIKLLTGAITTSGNYESFFTYQGQKLAHIINPKTGLPVTNVLSVSVLADTALDADALSTGTFVCGPEEAIELIEGMDNTEIIYIYRNKRSAIKVATSRGLVKKINIKKIESLLN